MTSSLSAHGFQTCMSKIQDLELRVASMEDYLNQQSILLDTLGSIMEEGKKHEH